MLGRAKRLVMDALPTAVAARLRLFRVRRLVAAFVPRVVEHTYGAGRLRVRLTDGLAAGWYDHDWPDLPEIAALRGTKLRPGALVFDAGAHQGVVALMLAREVAPGGRVVAVEASAHNAAAAAANRDLNGAAHLEVLHAAVSDRAGELAFNEGLNGQIDDGTGAWGRVTVPAVTIDGLADRYGPPDVVFIDIEGAEQLALAGAARTLAGPADFFVEVHAGCGLEQLGGSVDGVLAHFPADRYTVLVRADADTDSEFRPVRPGDPVTRDRFFLLALHRASGSQAAQSATNVSRSTAYTAG